MPLITVILCTYNRDTLLPQAIQSVLEQSLGDFELIVVDDGSSDNTKAVVDQFIDSRIRYVYQKNAGLAAGRNRGLSLAKGEWIAFIDDDDRYLPEKLSQQIAFLHANREFGWCAGGHYQIDTQSGEKRVWQPDLVYGQEVPLREWLFACPVCPTAVMVKRTWLEQIGRFETELDVIDDWDCWLRLAYAGCRMGLHPEVVCEYTIHANNMSRQIAPIHQRRQNLLSRFFSQAGLSPTLAEQRVPAYSLAYLQMACQQYSQNQMDAAKKNLLQAVELDTKLLANDGQAIFNALYGEIAKFVPESQREATLHNAWNHLATSLYKLQPNLNGKSKHFSAIQRFYKVVQGEKWPVLVGAWSQLVLYAPTHLKKRGVWSLMFKSALQHYFGRFNKIGRSSLLLLLMSLLSWGIASSVQAQTPEGITTQRWSRPTSLFQTNGELANGGMAMEGDSVGHVHILFTHTPNSNSTMGIDHLFWDGQIWSEPSNILIDPENGNLLSPQLIIDESDQLHLLTIGHNNALYYSHAFASSAHSAQAWSPPLIIGRAIGVSAITYDAAGRIYIIFSNADSSIEGQILLISSSDKGQTWSNPVTIATTPKGTVASDLQLVSDKTERLHISWTVYSLREGNRTLSSFYSHSQKPDFTAWIKPYQFAKERHGQSGLAVVDEDVHLVWRSNIGGDGTFHQWSQDGGQTWEKADWYDDKGGFSGPPFFAIDSRNQLHYTIGPAYYTYWSGGRLSFYEDLATSSIRETAEISEGEGAVLTITDGNTLHAIFHTDFKDIWYTQKQLSVPKLEYTPVPSPTPRQTASPVATIATLSTEVSTPQATSLPFPLNRQRPESSFDQPIIFGVLPSVLIVVIAMIIVQLRKR